MTTRTDTPPPAWDVADSHDGLRVPGARGNNLKAVSIEIPKRRLTVFTGLSGPGKSSLVFGTNARSTVATPTAARSTLTGEHLAAYVCT